MGKENKTLGTERCENINTMYIKNKIIIIIHRLHLALNPRNLFLRTITLPRDDRDCFQTNAKLKVEFYKIRFSCNIGLVARTVNFVSTVIYERRTLGTFLRSSDI